MAREDDNSKTLRRGEAQQIAQASGDDLPVTPATEQRYALAAELGRGGLGRVVAAEDTVLRREVALKEALQADPDSRTRLIREARITGYLQHPGIVPVHDLGSMPDGPPFYAMKRIEGGNLGAALDAAKGLTERLELLGHMVALSQALAFAHHRGIIHRDVKPTNVMVGRFGETVLVDWGLAKVLGEDDPYAEVLQSSVMRVVRGASSDTRQGEAVGTPAYMSPEQARGEIEAVDARSDVWALGVMLYELLTGQRPFQAPGVTALRWRRSPKAAVHAPLPLSAVAPTRPPRTPASQRRWRAPTPPEPALRLQLVDRLADESQRRLGTRTIGKARPSQGRRSEPARWAALTRSSGLGTPRLARRPGLDQDLRVSRCRETSGILLSRPCPNQAVRRCARTAMPI